ncbi:MAG: hypothetical protein LC102_02345 [Ignavibacteriales bacterium]|nr:MAG: hypothetical protein F9K26_01755 [Ignavibacteriaceae bacterium]MBW7872163.1 hypothetical protein [Ignavibacteria bacterium]MCZ2142253.1 hypothetical protein [Ignavibacteriales bacterium]OQY78799.1 MAG: hypothetical protein B6D45_01785 [Ignavibacteriales bacterium UTCHB3]MBV6445692.1 hypothetical protein [Ignavibacteriaceae bacterium]
MYKLNKRDLTDKLYFKLREIGYSTIGRRYGTYLPNPPDIGEFEIDILAKRKMDFAIGIAIDDLSGVDIEFIKKKIRFLAGRKSTYSGNPVRLYIAVTRRNYFLLKHIIDGDLQDLSTEVELVLFDSETEMVISEEVVEKRAFLPRFMN